MIHVHSIRLIGSSSLPGGQSSWVTSAKGYTQYSIVYGIVYPFTGVGHPVKGYIQYSIVYGIVYPFTGWHQLPKGRVSA